MTLTVEQYQDAGWGLPEAKRMAGKFIPKLNKTAPINFKWTDEKIALLKKLHANGLSGSQKAIQLGTSRNSVISKCNRIGLTGEKQVSKARKPKVAKPRVSKPKNDPRPVLHIVEPIIEHNDTPTDHAKATVKLGDSDCKWPIGDPSDTDFIHCGCRQQAGSVYCQDHHKRAYTPQTRNRKAKAGGVFFNGRQV